MQTTTVPTEPSFLNAFVRSPWLRPLNDVAAIDDLLRLVRPQWSLTSIRARVVAAVRETADVRTLVLAPNRLWPGHRAGQHVGVEVEVEGRLLRRTFSVSSPAREDGLVAITVKRREAGRVSKWWNDTAAVGDVITLLPPSGDFVLPGELPAQIVMVSAGSGITPVMAILRELDVRRYAGAVRFVHCAHSRADVIFAAELEEISARSPWLDLELRLTAGEGRMNDSDWASLAEQSGEAAAFVCGPTGFMNAARRAWEQAGQKSCLRIESFGAPARAMSGGLPQSVSASRSARSFVAENGQSLLVAAENSGLRPAYGCRAGICHTCKCRKLSGVVEDLRDGRLYEEPGEMIQLCVTTARSAVTLDL